MQRPRGGHRCSGCFHHLYKSLDSFDSVSAYRCVSESVPCALRHCDRMGRILHFSMEHENSTAETLGMLTICFLQETGSSSWSKKKRLWKLHTSKLTHCLPFRSFSKPCLPEAYNSNAALRTLNKKLAPTMDFWPFRSAELPLGPIQRTKCSSPRSTKRNCRQSMVFYVFFSIQTALVKMIALKIDYVLRTPWSKTQNNPRVFEASFWLKGSYQRVKSLQSSPTCL